MCGICGIWNLKSRKNINLERDINNMIATIKHRGPDNQGYKIFYDKKLALGHVRLSIIDLSEAGNQPMNSLNKDTWICFNGEIYNYKDIKKNLLKKGFKFRSETDTEVILNNFIYKKEKGIKDLRGMFAFAIWDNSLNELYLVRDRIGIKPLYYFYDGDVLAFASEIKALLSINYIKEKLSFNYNLIPFYLMYGYFPKSYTVFNEIKKLEPGSILKLSSKNILTVKQYWDICIGEEGKHVKNNTKVSELIEFIEAKLIEALNYRLIADVPIGTFLSGGIDSSLITAIVSKKLNYDVTAFTIGFENKEYDESIYASKVAKFLNIKHLIFKLSDEDLIKQTKSILNKLDEPFGDNSIVVTYALSKYTKEYVKVVLSGDGGDELFCGYNHYIAALKLHKFLKFIPFLLRKEILQRVPVSLYKLILRDNYNLVARINRIRETFLLKDPNLSNIFLILRSYFTFKEIKGILNFDFLVEDQINNLLINFSNCGTMDSIKSLMFHDLKNYLVNDILYKVDLASMANSLEARETFLDHIFVENILSVKNEFICYNQNKKYILKQLLSKYLPNDLIDRPKRGFSMPVISLLYDKEIKDYFFSEKLERIFNKNFLVAFRKSIEDGRYIYPNNNYWVILSLSAWMERWNIKL